MGCSEGVTEEIMVEMGLMNGLANEVRLEFLRTIVFADDIGICREQENLTL